MKANQLLLPAFGVRELSLLYGPAWKALIDNLKTRSVADPHTIALSLMCRRLARQHNHRHTCGCGYWCALCMADILTASHVNENHILALYDDTLSEILLTQKTIRTNRNVRHRQNDATDFSRVRHTKEFSMFGIAELMIGAAVVLTLGLAGSAAIVSVLLWTIHHNEESVIHD